MKLLIAVIQPTKLAAVREALANVEVTRMTVCDAQSFGHRGDRPEIFRGHAYSTVVAAESGAGDRRQ